MTRAFSRAAGAAMMLVWSAGVLAAESIESIENRLVSNWDRLDSLSASIRMDLEVRAGSGRMTQKGSGRYEYLRQGEARRFRQELEVENVIDLGGSERVIRQKTLTVCNGTFVYHLTDKEGVKSAVRDRADSRLAAHVGGRAFFDYLRANYVLKVLADQELEGRPVCVLEATPKLYRGGEGGRQLIHFDKERGMMVKNVVLNSAGQVMETTTYTDVQVNPKIGTERFRFQAPEGVTVIDLARDRPVLQAATQPTSRPAGRQ